MEIKEIKNKEVWENFLLDCKEKTFLQSWNWGEFQKIMGSEIWRLGIYQLTDDRYQVTDLVGVALVVKIEAKRGTFLFCPHAPVVRAGNSKSEIRNPKSRLRRGSSIISGQIRNSKFEILNILVKELKKIAKKENCSFIRVAPVWLARRSPKGEDGERNEENIKIFKKLGFREAPIHIHPEVTWQLDITLPEEELLRRMRKTTRYLIRQGLKNKELKIEKSQNSQDVEVFNSLYQRTVNRHHFVPFSLQYLKNEFLAFSKDNEISIFLARYRGEYLASAMIIFWQGIAFYHQGASVQKYPKIPASYLLQWEAIKEAKKRNCKIYNFWGIAPIFAETKIENPKFEILNPKQIPNSKSQIPNKRHPWYGLTLFKTGFGGYEKEYLRTQDLPLNFKYWLTFLFEKIRKIKRRL
ncbi:MAG: peptidoglycan bridge formation glycyltransferase FemA/FemB family protein [Patescibacteria group bacterium]|nr:peptidoglycan bridge formation glycyltransferase FemA/FemB family protein [Patescibacteria group bacterium]